RGVHPGLHHLAERRVGVAVPDRPRHLHPADPALGAYGAVLRPDHRRRLGPADAGHRRRDGGGRGDAGPDVPDQMTVPLTLSGVSAHYGRTQVLSDLSLDVAAGELVSL